MCNKGWKICAAPGDLTNQICPGVGNLIKMFSGDGARFDRFLKICPGFAGGGGDGNNWNCLEHNLHGVQRSCSHYDTFEVEGVKF